MDVLRVMTCVSLRQFQDGGNNVLRNVGILAQQYKASEPERHKLEYSQLLKPQLSHTGVYAKLSGLATRSEN
jgi:hypothetical protein